MSRLKAAIIASIGGDHSCHLLPHLDFELIAANPKVFMGYSDITVLNVAIWQRAPIGRVEPATRWTEELLDWRTRTDLTRARRMSDAAGWSWLREGAAEGELVGGCIESLQHLRGTDFWPDLEGRILFLETSEEKPSPARIDGMLMDYENMGVLARIAALLVGRPMYYSDSEKAELREVVLRRTANYGFPVVTDMDFGHTAPQLTVPVGCAARLDSDSRTFEVLEAAVADDSTARDFRVTTYAEQHKR